MIQEKNHDLILQLKQIREERELSYQKILDMVEESGGSISMSTVRRVFAPDSEDKSFRYEDTIKPLVVAMLGINGPSPEGGSQSTEIEALKTVIGIKNQENAELAAENERVKAEYEGKLSYILNEAEQKHTHIVELTEQTKDLTARIKFKDHIIFWLSFVLISLLLLAVVALVIDRIDPDLGYFWRTMASTQGGSEMVKQIYNGARLFFV